MTSLALPMGGHRVGAQEHGRTRREFDAMVEELRGEGMLRKDIAARLGVTQSVVQKAMKRRGLDRPRAVYNFETALDYVDEIRLMRGPDSYDGNKTYIVSLDGDSVIGKTFCNVRSALNDAMRQLPRGAA